MVRMFFVMETGGRVVHRDTLQFVNDKHVIAPVGVEASEKNRAAMMPIYARIAKCLERHTKCVTRLIRELARRRQRREQERHLGHPVPAGHHELDEPGTWTCWCPFRVNISGLLKFWWWALIESLLVDLIL